MTDLLNEEKAIRILTFDGQDKNWNMWSKKFLARASYQGYKEVLVSDSIVVPSASEILSDAKDSDKQKLKLRVANQKAYDALILAMSDETCFNLVDESKTTALPEGDARKAWLNLEEKFRPTKGLAMMEVLTKFNRSILKEGDDPLPWILELEKLRSQLKKLKVDKSDDDILIHIMGNVPKAYEATIDHAMSLFSEGKLTLMGLRASLVEKYQRIHMKPKEESAMVMFSGNQKSRRKCEVCGGPHETKLCWELESNASKRNKNWKSKMHSDSENSQAKNANDKKKKFKCYHCHQFGHLANKCPKKNKSQSNEKETEVAQAATTKEYMLLTYENKSLQSDPHFWLADSGASCHMVNSTDGLFDIYKDVGTVHTADGELNFNFRGKFKGRYVDESGSEKVLILRDVAYVPGSRVNLFSLTRAVNVEKCELIGKEGEFIIKKPGFSLKFSNQVQTTHGGVMGITLIPVKTETEIANLATLKEGKIVCIKYLHEVMNHAGIDVVMATAKDLKVIPKGKFDPCQNCAEAKAKQQKLKKLSENKAKYPGERILIDISSQMKYPSKGGKRYWVMIMDEKSGYKWSIFLKEKGDLCKAVYPIIEKLIKTDHKVKFLRMDNAGENQILAQKLNENHPQIQIEFTPVNTPQYNPIERHYATLWGRVRAMLNAAKLKEEMRGKFWAECAATATLVENVLVNKNNEKSPHMMMFNARPNYARNLRKFGELGVVKTAASRSSKLDNKGELCVFLGYAVNHPGDTYRMMSVETEKITESRDVTWLNKVYGSYLEKESEESSIELEGTNQVEQINVKDVPEIYEDEPVIAQNEMVDFQGQNSPINQSTQYSEDESLNEDSKDYDVNLSNDSQETESEYAPDTEDEDFSDEKYIRPTKLDNVLKNLEWGEFSFVAKIKNSQEIDEPHSFIEAWNHKDSLCQKGWREAIKKEFHDMIRKGVWRHKNKSDIPKDRRLIGSKWVFKIKNNGVYRARLVALGYSQIPGVDYTENYAPVLTDTTFRVLLILWLTNNWDSEIVDVETAFLYGQLDQEIFMKCPEGLGQFIGRKIKEDECLILDKSIYGLVQAARQFWKKFIHCLKTIGFIHSKIDPCLLKRETKNGICFFGVYVDDNFCIGDKIVIEDSIQRLQKFFDLKRLGPMKEFIGCSIERKNDKVFLWQPYLIKNMEKKFGELVKGLKTYKTPAAPGMTTTRPTEEMPKLSESQQTMFRSGIGMLMYLIKHSRPDLSNATRELAKVMDGATLKHWKDLLRVIKFTIDTKNWKLIFKSNQGTKWKLEAYSDSDFAGDKDTRTSVTGYILYLCGVPIAWKSRGQRSVTLSSTEAEYVALSEISCEILFVKQMLEFINREEIEFPIQVNVDNAGAIFMANNRTTSQRTKHVDTRYHFVREYVEDGILKVVYVMSEKNDADPFTKNVNEKSYWKNVQKYMYIGDQVIGKGVEKINQE